MNAYEIKWGDNGEVLKTLPDNFVDCCVTSPSYYNLRDYHAGEKEIGHEDTPEEYVLKLRDVFHEVKRVLKPTGTLWLNLGDSYDKNKNLIGIPWRVAFALQDDGWVLRNDIIWHKINPMPNSVTDRCASSHEYMFLFSKQPSGYYFDYEAIEEPASYTEVLESRKRAFHENETLLDDEIFKPDTDASSLTFPKFGGNKYPNADSGADSTYSGKQWQPKQKNMLREENGQSNHSFHKRRAEGLPDESYVVRRKRDVWTIAIKGYTGAHFATFPEKLVEPCILAGCPKGGIVLDCFNGAATTGVVALKNHRRYLGIELNPEYIKISEERIAKATAQKTFNF